MRQMSELSAIEWNLLQEQSMSPSEAVERLYHDFPQRNFSEVLRKLHPSDDLRECLTNALILEGRQPQSADRTVRNWLSGKVVCRSRETAFHIAFALKLNVSQTNSLLHAMSDYGIHARDPKEVVYLFALQTGHSWDEAQSLLARCLLLKGTAIDKAIGTQILEKQVDEIRTDGEFLAWYAEHVAVFSQQHETARSIFVDMFNQLTGGDLSIDYIDRTCIHLRNAVPACRNRTQLDALQRIAKRYWPNATTVKEILNGHADVSRKVIILLYILNEGCNEDEYSELDEAYVSPRDRLNGHVLALDALLESCCMSVLDPRSAFDWMVLYCLRTDVDESMEERMENFMSILFRSEIDSTIV